MATTNVNGWAIQVDRDSMTAHATWSVFRIDLDADDVARMTIAGVAHRGECHFRSPVLAMRDALSERRAEVACG